MANGCLLSGLIRKWQELWKSEQKCRYLMEVILNNWKFRMEILLEELELLELIDEPYTQKVKFLDHACYVNDNQAKLWHRRLGHMSVGNMRQLQKVAEGVSYNLKHKSIIINNQ
ncbi:GAG-pre-integrase domain [Popillia japonica]|uniref:GAG-pre-integrase domain n=1 Tax=Popillia japonica TaxID=7064 RepID=A0AAW1MEV9_POPJA